MAAPTNYYVDPLNGNDSTGNGTSGTPWKSVQKALNTITRNASNGDQINVRDTADDVLAASLSFTTYGTPTPSAPLVVRGYTTTAGDGGRATLDGGANVVLATAGGASHTYFVDLILKTSAGTSICNTTAYSLWFFRCEFRTGRGVKVLWGAFWGCTFDTETGYRCIDTSSDPGDIKLYHCYFKNGGASGTTGMLAFYNSYLHVYHCIFNVADTYTGIYLESQVSLNPRHVTLINNSFYGNNGSGEAIRFRNSAAVNHIHLINNVFADFPTGYGIRMMHAGNSIGILANNAFYNVGTPKSVLGTLAADLNTDIVLVAEPFLDPANGDFRVTTALKAAGYPSSFLGSNTNQYLDIGAAQRQEAGGLAISPIGSHIIRGLV